MIYKFDVSRIDEKTKSEIRDTPPAKHVNVYKKDKLFYEALLLSFIFYVLPAGQMAYNFYDQQKTSGNQDTCYYNDLCRRSLGSLNFSVFNHVFREGSNLFAVKFWTPTWPYLDSRES